MMTVLCPQEVNFNFKAQIARIMNRSVNVNVNHQFI